MRIMRIWQPSVSHDQYMTDVRNGFRADDFARQTRRPVRQDILYEANELKLILQSALRVVLPVESFHCLHLPTLSTKFPPSTSNVPSALAHQRKKVRLMANMFPSLSKGKSASTEDVQPVHSTGSGTGSGRTRTHNRQPSGLGLASHSLEDTEQDHLSMPELRQSLEGDDVVITRARDKPNTPLELDQQPHEEPAEGPSVTRLPSESRLKALKESYTMKQYEHSAMLIVRLWNHRNDSPEFSDLVNRHITAVDVAKASGIVSMMGRKRVEELRAETHLGTPSSERFRTLRDTLPTTMKDFRTGPNCRADGYDLPDLDTLSRRGSVDVGIADRFNAAQKQKRDQRAEERISQLEQAIKDQRALAERIQRLERASVARTEHGHRAPRPQDLAEDVYSPRNHSPQLHEDAYNVRHTRNDDPYDAHRSDDPTQNTGRYSSRDVRSGADSHRFNDYHRDGAGRHHGYRNNEYADRAANDIGDRQSFPIDGNNSRRSPREEEHPAYMNRREDYFGRRARRQAEAHDDPPRENFQRPFSNNGFRATDRPFRLKPDDVMTFDPASTNVKFFIRRIRIVAQQEGVQSVLNVLPFCLKGRALTWHTELPDDIQDEMAYSLDAWIRALDTEFATNPINARREARELRFSFARADDVTLADYLIKKVSLLRAAGTTDPESIKSELWEGLDYRLASLVPPTPTETLEQFKQRIRANEAGAKRLWDAEQYKSRYRQQPFTKDYTKEDRINRLLSKLGKNPLDNADIKEDSTPDKATDSKTSSVQKRSSGREPARPCRHCGGKHWDNDCTKKPKPKQVNALEIDDLDDKDIELLEELTSDTMSESSTN
ncbi:hypothetical protein IFM46972_02956 [Aspergillus udagawae]|uniref:Retrotransposon gag domain-containing protein n=1 Tax=Aspergillus udagawae TaxID=91492 RepID=A0A8H3RMF8_9EURO|nr:hypothetical protein IFM46972_02956 [Aspergillus udagawae]